MRYPFVLLILLISFSISAQEKYNLKDSQKAQDELNAEYTNPETTILPKEDFKHFQGLKFYPLDEKYIVEAAFIKTPDEKPFFMETSTTRKSAYIKYGEIYFHIDKKEYTLNVYKMLPPYKDKDLKDYLFIPFTDETNGSETYGGGRYMDKYITDIQDNKIIIDFNAAYNPYCAYTTGYSCPIVPEDNDLKLRIEAGVKAYHPN